jgi:hypothetical protein
LIFGVAGFVLGVLNYRRDRAKVVVQLAWDLSVTQNPLYDPKKSWGLIDVTNVGRRSIYVSHVSLKLPKKYNTRYLLVGSIDSIGGAKLSEGDSPQRYPVTQDGMEKYAEHWREVVAQVSDSTRKFWTSKRVSKDKVPSWAKRG